MKPPFRPRYFERIYPLDLPETANVVYRHANTMCLRAVEEPFYTRFQSYNSEIVSDDVIVVGDDASRRYILVGATTAFRSLTFLSAVWHGRRLVQIRLWQPDVQEGEEPEKVVVLEGSDWRQLLLDYGEKIASDMQAIRPPKGQPNVTGYCTWYYYYKDVTEANFLENVEALAQCRENSKFKSRYVQIDDGYQTFQGDWNDQDPSWPTPLDEIAARITGHGMEAGIWTMPFHASTASRVFREHPDWFVKGEDGRPLVAKGWSPPPDDRWATLDTTQPAVLDHLRDIFRTFRKWGYTYFKMDGLGFALTDGVRSDPQATPVSAFRLGLQAIREAVPDSFLLACSQHFLPCVGLVDGARFSDDTSAWAPEALQRAFDTSLARFWMFEKLFEADPDVLIARQDVGRQTLGESRISVLSGILTGFALTSDHLGTIAPDRLALLERGATMRVRDVKPMFPLGAPPWRWPHAFTGTFEGRRAWALVNPSGAKENQLWRLADLEGHDASAPVEELLHPMGRMGDTVIVPPGDAVLLVEAAR